MHDDDFRRIRFFEAIDHDEDLIAIIRGHIYVERQLNELILLMIPGSDSLLVRLPFTAKVRALRELGIISSEESRALAWLASLRNRFAHSETTLRATDAQEACRSATVMGLNYINDMKVLYHREDTQSVVRFAITGIWADMNYKLDELPKPTRSLEI